MQHQYAPGAALEPRQALGCAGTGPAGWAGHSHSAGFLGTVIVMNTSPAGASY